MERSVPVRSRATPCAAVACLVLAACAGALPVPERPPAARELFHFESGFWLNLHHALYESARLAERGRRWPEEDLGSGWEAAAARYRAGWIGRDLLFDPELSAVKDLLAAAPEDGGPPAGLPANLAQALSEAAPAYRAWLWPAHDAENRAWVAQLAPLLELHGQRLARRLEALLQSSWPPEAVRVDVVHVANWAGAYSTVEPPHAVIASAAPANQGDAALEIAFHEAGHALIGEVRRTLERLGAEDGREAPDLWHAVLFDAAREVLGADYVPYAEAHGLWERGAWPSHRAAIRGGWRRWADGKAGFEDALRDTLARSAAGEGVGSPPPGD